MKMTSHWSQVGPQFYMSSVLIRREPQKEDVKTQTRGENAMKKWRQRLESCVYKPRNVMCPLS